MNKKISLGAALALCILSVTVTFAITMASSKNIYNKIINNLSLRTSESAALDEIDRLVSNYYYGTAEHKTREITSSVVEGYINGLGDENCSFLSSEEYARYNEKLTGTLTGIGMETLFDASTGKLTAAWVYEDSPAEISGLQKGDVIVEIDGTAVTAKNHAALTEKLFGGRLTGIEIVFERNGERKTVQPMMGFTIPTVISEVNGSTAIIRISGFFNNTPAEFEKAVASAKEKGAAAFIIDLRGTCEGTAENAAKALDVLVPVPADGRPLAATFDKKGIKLDVYAAESGDIKARFAVLINSSTAGAAELFACDLHDISAAPLIGSTTKGIGTVQRAFALESGDAVILTVARLEPFEPQNAYDKTGLTPTKKIDAPELSRLSLLMTPPQRDPALKAALAMFS